MNDVLISLEEVSKVYQVGGENFIALSDVGLKVETESFMSFVGPSGSGKTTLLNLIGGLDRPTSGKVFFRGNNLGTSTRGQLAEYRKKNIGFIFQTYNLLPVYSVFENVLFPLLLNGLRVKDVRDRVENMVEKVGLKDQMNKKPSQLSGGQCQRVAIARALVKDPLLILADEPTANLDSKNSHQILELMQELNQEFKSAVVFSTHDEKVTRYIKREIHLEDGKICWDKNRDDKEL
jgi:putative ABC transport system ATP-binding protein